MFDLTRTACLILLVGACGSNPSLARQPSMLARVDTTRPPIPVSENLPRDSTFTVEAPDLPRAECLYYRNIVAITFDDTTSGSTIRSLLHRYSGSVIGGNPGIEYVVQIPDPGPTFTALEAITTKLSSEPGVANARKVYYRTPTYPDGH
jgi:hypothetical protein